jgi:NADPH-dependent curcumin reductase CurA
MQNVMNRRKRMYLRGSNECRKAFLRLLHGKNFGKQIVRIH